MKNILLLSLLLTTVSCKDYITVRLPGDDTTKYVENSFDNSGNENRLADLETRVSLLESQVALNISQIQNNDASIVLLRSQLSNEVLSLQEDIAALSQEIASTKQELEDADESNAAATQLVLSELEADLAQTKLSLNNAISQGGTAYTQIMNNIGSLTNSSSTLQTTVNTLVGQMAALQLQDAVVEMVDPCPSVASSGYKEVFVKMKSGKLVAYFESGSNRFLTVLTNGTYRTTDSRACNFTVNNGVITN